MPDSSVGSQDTWGRSEDIRSRVLGESTHRGTGLWAGGSSELSRGKSPQPYFLRSDGGNLLVVIKW